ncbi:MAG: urease accessory UreF family protein [Verrucomicrobiaceae bacterium]
MLALHTGETRLEHDESLAWVRWLFQSVRAQSAALVFQSAAVDRPGLIADWLGFSDEIFLRILAPVLLRGWQNAQAGDDALLAACDHELHKVLPVPLAGRSIAAGEILLEQTRGAKYQGALGRLRQRYEKGETPGHLAVVWSAIAALFQMPPLDLLTEYLREEWLVGARDSLHPSEPQGPLSFEALAHRALHEARMMDFRDAV